MGEKKISAEDILEKHGFYSDMFVENPDEYEQLIKAVEYAQSSKVTDEPAGQVEQQPDKGDTTDKKIMMKHCSDNGLLGIRLGKSILNAMREYHSTKTHEESIEDREVIYEEISDEHIRLLNEATMQDIYTKNYHLYKCKRFGITNEMVSVMMVNYAERYHKSKTTKGV